MKLNNEAVSGHMIHTTNA